MAKKGRDENEVKTPKVSHQPSRVFLVCGQVFGLDKEFQAKEGQIKTLHILIDSKEITIQYKVEMLQMKNERNREAEKRDSSFRAICRGEDSMVGAGGNIGFHSEVFHF